MFAIPKVNPRNEVVGKRHRARAAGGTGRWRGWEEVRAPLPRCILGLIKMAYTWASHRPSRSTALAMALAVALLAFAQLAKGRHCHLIRFLPPPLAWTHNLPRATHGQPVAILQPASAAPCVSLSPASRIAESAGDKIKVIIVPAARPPMVPFTAARTKKKRKKAATPVAPAGASVDASTATPAPSTAPVTKEGKTTRKKKAGKTIDLCTMPMWAKMTNSASHCIVAIAHGQKWVVGNAVTINGDVANKPSSGCQWYQKGPSSKRIAPSNPDFADML